MQLKCISVKKRKKRKEIIRDLVGFICNPSIQEVEVRGSRPRLAPETQSLRTASAVGSVSKRKIKTKVRL